ncbi:uncharacterized protein LAESUDRAFT_711190 [Laetiporus sulphureus 93-53]|uniref:Matrin-type domain-containing protein n=1 Tax=Laetiporus sulphureus 93-53 TaxID=1314785 RepID=A0A165GRU2_9APHY|nr:uncharacterized protein LAESUDRAFT_711190 [Laetiporus sulphureus 93-53]KZT10720.1 hypothetical protein LAESUDRAFT_711190 [Laetiporus sulphureus 93-53]
MSEYWVSHKKYFCKYCNIYIADDAPSRRQHESGLRHKGNVERFVRGLYKEGEKRKQDQDEEKREMARVEQAAKAAFALDVSTGLVKPGSSSTSVASTSAAARKPAPKPGNPYADYSTAESLGYTDPDAERLKAEAELHRIQGVAGEWEIVTVAESAAPTEQESTPSVKAEEGYGKREAEQPPDNEDARHFKLRRRTVGVGLGEVYDPGLIPTKVKKQEEPEGSLPPAAFPDSSQGQSAVASGSSATPLPKWSAKGWTRPGEKKTRSESREASQGQQTSPEAKEESDGASVKQEEPPAPEVVEPASVKQEPSALDETESTSVKVEESVAAPMAPSGGGMFRKRKLPAGGAGSRGRRA